MRADNVFGFLGEWRQVKSFDYRAVTDALRLRLVFPKQVRVFFLEYGEGNNALILSHESDYVSVLKSAPSSPVCLNMYCLLLFQLLQ